MVKMGFRYATPPAALNQLQGELGLREQVSINLFRSRLKVLKDDATGFNRFDG